MLVSFFKTGMLEIPTVLGGNYQQAPTDIAKLVDKGPSTQDRKPETGNLCKNRRQGYRHRPGLRLWNH